MFLFKGSLEHSPRLSDAFRKQSSLAGGTGDAESLMGRGAAAPGGAMEGRLKEDLAEAMKETEQGQNNPLLLVLDPAQASQFLYQPTVTYPSLQILTFHFY